MIQTRERQILYVDDTEEQRYAMRRILAIFASCALLLTAAASSAHTGSHPPHQLFNEGIALLGGQRRITAADFHQTLFQQTADPGPNHRIGNHALFNPINCQICRGFQV